MKNSLYFLGFSLVLVSQIITGLDDVQFTHVGNRINRFGLLANSLGVAPVPGIDRVAVSAVSVNSTTVPILLQPPKAEAISTLTCKCTPESQCIDPPTDGSGTIDPRVVNTPPGIVCAAGEKYCCFDTPAPVKLCGVPNIIPVPGHTSVYGQADFGEYPWTALLVAADGSIIGGGALIDSLNVLTVAHKVTPNTPVKVRLGEWNRDGDTEPYKYVDINVQQAVYHVDYNSANLQNDIALVQLVSPINVNSYPHINTVCLPAQGTSFSNQRCWVSGFGTDAFGTGKLNSIMKEVDVPIVDGNSCQERLRQTRLGKAFILNQKSFICAGGEEGKDACTGDGGSAVVCQTAEGQYTATGLVAWGIGCAAKEVPGVYANIPSYITWIEANKKK